MNTPITFPVGLRGARSSLEGERENLGFRYFAYVAIAITAFIAGLIFGQSSGPTSGGSRIPWPTPVEVVPHPRSLHL
jgi:hypothetical protein